MIKQYDCKNSKNRESKSWAEQFQLFLHFAQQLNMALFFNHKEY